MSGRYEWRVERVCRSVDAADDVRHVGCLDDSFNVVQWALGVDKSDRVIATCHESWDANLIVVALRVRQNAVEDLEARIAACAEVSR